MSLYSIVEDSTQLGFKKREKKYTFPGSYKLLFLGHFSQDLQHGY